VPEGTGDAPCESLVNRGCDDNCPRVPNLMQADADGDGLGDVCDDDLDGDGVANTDDNCPREANARQLDTFGDDEGDACSDVDGDWVIDRDDNCPEVFNLDQADLDGDREGDRCDPDDDDDGIRDDADNCPLLDNRDQADGDGDGVGTACDNCPEDANASQRDTEYDGLGDACDPDDDDDGVLDDADNCPRTDNPNQYDQDGNGVGTACDGAEQHAQLRSDFERAIQAAMFLPLTGADAERTFPLPTCIDAICTPEAESWTIRVGADRDFGFVVVDEMGTAVGSWRTGVAVDDPTATFDEVTEIVVEPPLRAQARLGTAGRPDGVYRAGHAYSLRVRLRGEFDPTGVQPPEPFNVGFEVGEAGLVE